MIAGRYSERDSQADALVATMGTKPFPDHIEAQAIVAAGEALKSEKTERRRDKDGRIGYVQVPDHALRAAVAVKIIEHNLGKPVQRSITANLPAPGSSNSAHVADELLAMLLAAPDAAADIVEKLKRAAEKAQKSKPLEIDVTPPLPKDPPPSN